MYLYRKIFCESSVFVNGRKAPILWWKWVFFWFYTRIFPYDSSKYSFYDFFLVQIIRLPIKTNSSVIGACYANVYRWQRQKSMLNLKHHLYFFLNISKIIPCIYLFNSVFSCTNIISFKACIFVIKSLLEKNCVLG